MTGSAVSQDVRYNFDSTANFSKFKTYTWVTMISEAPIDKLTDEQIKASLDAGLARKGLKKVDTYNADLFIGYQTTEHISEKFSSFSPGWTVGPGWAAGGLSSGGTAGGKSSEVYKGELAVDMIRSCEPALDLERRSQQEPVGCGSCGSGSILWEQGSRSGVGGIRAPAFTYSRGHIRGWVGLCCVGR